MPVLDDDLAVGHPPDDDAPGEVYLATGLLRFLDGEIRHHSLRSAGMAVLDAPGATVNRLGLAVFHVQASLERATH